MTLPHTPRPVSALSLAVRLKEGGWQEAGCHASLGELLVACGRYEEAVGCFERCLQIRQTLSSTMGAAYVECLVRLCIASSLAGDHAAAEKRAHEVIALEDQPKAALPASLAPQFWAALAVSLQHQSKFREAADVQHVRLKSACRRFERGQKQTRTVLNTLGFVYDVLGGQGASEIEKQCRQRAMLALSNQHRGKLSMANDDSIIHGNTMYSLARLLLQQGQPLEAQPLMEQALRIFEKIHGRSHPRVAFALTTLASCLASQPGKQRKGLRLLDRSIHILAVTYGEDGVQAAEPGGPLQLKAKVSPLAAGWRTPPARRGVEGPACLMRGGRPFVHASRR